MDWIGLDWMDPSIPDSTYYKSTASGANNWQIFVKYLANLCEIFVRENIENSWEGHQCWKWHMVHTAPFTLCWQYFHFKIQLPMYHVFSLLSYLLVADIVKFANHVDNTMFTRHLTTAFYRHLAIHSWYINTENTLDGTVLKLVLPCQVPRLTRMSVGRGTWLGLAWHTVAWHIAHHCLAYCPTRSSRCPKMSNCM